MSQTKKLKSILLAIFTIFTFFVFGCGDTKVDVDNISVNLESQSQIVLLVDDFFDLTGQVEITPSYATDKTFSIYSLNENVARIVGNKIVAVGVGETFIRVVSNSNENVEDVISVSVVEESITLDSPLGLEYDESAQTFKFNPVDNAASYTININGLETNIGNINVFKLSDYVGQKYNEVLKVVVRANAPTFGKAYVNSNYSSEIKIYQTEKVENVSIVGGKLNFPINSALVYDVYFDNVKVYSELTSGEIDLTSLSEDFAGQTKKVKVVAGPGANTKQQINQSGVTYVSSTSNEVVLNILDEPEIEMKGDIISWNAIPFADGYTVFIGSNPIIVENNYLDLKTLPNYAQLGNVETKVKVVTNLSQNSKNVAKTTEQSNEITFTRLQTPTISVLENGFSWNTIANATTYFVQVKSGNNILFAASTSVTNFDLSKYGAGTYDIEVYAVGNNDLENFLSSNVATSKITKYGEVSATISNYELRISATQNEEYFVKFSIDDNNTYGEIKKANSNEIVIDLSIYNFKYGLHSIEITQLGKSTNNTINGLTKVVSFTQLEAVNVVINNSIASVAKSSTNQNATIALQISGGVLADVINIDAETYVFNTTNVSGEHFLAAGEYEIVAFVKGNGKETFSYRGSVGVGKDAVDCEATNFTVLAVPGLEVLDKSITEISVKPVANAVNYSILNETEQIIDSSVTDKYAFDLASGETKTFKVRANGNGSSTLSSLSSEVITVTRLITPTVTFFTAANAGLNMQENSFKFDANNNLDYYDAINFYHNNTLMNSYAAGGTYSGFVEGVNTFKVDLISKGLVEGVYYINSLADEVEVNKYLTANKIYTDNNNNIVVENPNNEKLFIDLTINGIKYADNGSNQIVNGSVVLDYTYSNGKYFINIFDNNEIKIADVNQGDNLIVQARFRRISESNNVDSDISSQFSINYLIAPTFVRNDQSIYFESTYTDYDLDDYNFIVKNETGTIQKTISMSTLVDLISVEETGTSTKYQIAMTDLWNVLKGEGFVATDVNSLSIQILNSLSTQDVPKLASYGDEILVQQAQSFVIVAEKDNGLTNVKVQTVQTDYEKTYVVDVLGEIEYSNNDGSIIRILLDDKVFAGELNIFGYVKANSSYENTNTVYVFNSANSNILTVERLLVSTLSVNNNTIYYTSVSNATSYEVYELVSGVFVLVDESRLQRVANGFRFNNFEENTDCTIKVRAVTNNSEIVNSNLSESITIAKIGKASATMINGKVGIKLPSGWQQAIQAGVQLKLALDFAGRTYSCNIIYDAHTYLTSIDGITWSQDNDAFMVNSGLIFNYNDAYIIEKTLKIGLELNGAYDGKYYLYSDVYETSTGNGVKTVFAPTSVKVDKLDDYAQSLSWENNAKNSLTNGGEKIKIDQYMFAFIYGGETYYSTDAKLKYKTSTGFASYGLITTAYAQFPYGYDANNDGDFDDENDVVFGDGDYTFMVAAYKDEYAVSPYSEAYTFTVLPQTELSIYDGKLTWTAVANATSYVVRIKNLLSSMIATKEISSGLIYDLDDFGSENEFFNVTVQAITTNSGMLNSKESESLMFYRLPVASEVKIDDGVLKVKASPLAYTIDVIYNGKTYRYENADQEKKIKEVIESKNVLQIMQLVKDLGLVANHVEYTIDLSADYPELIGATGAIKIGICGNSGVVYDVNSIKVGMVNSKTTTKSINAQVLQTNVNEVKSGVWKFSHNSELNDKTITQLSYNFNNVAAVHDFWKDTIVYKINIDATNGDVVTNHVIYVVDYDRFISAVKDGTLKTKTEDPDSQTYYELCYDKLGLYARIVYRYYSEECLYFNVYLDDVINSDGNEIETGNVINLQDHDVLYYSPIAYNEGKNTNTLEEVKLAEGGSFVVNIRTLGGDEFKAISGSTGEEYDKAYFSSPNYEQIFVRYGINRVSTLNGQVVVKDFKIEGLASPIYKIGVIPHYAETDLDWTYVYLYDADQVTEEDVRNFLKLPADAVCEPMIFVENNKIKYVAFEMSKYFGPEVTEFKDIANYKLNIRTLAGVGADKYLLNAKEPESVEYATISVFNAPTVKIYAGNIVFNTSNVNRDGVFHDADNYEISVTFEGVEYKEEFSVYGLDCKKEGEIITYILPSKIGDLTITNEGNYQFKIRAITSEDSFVNSKFTDNKQFTRETSVANVRIEEGKLKWTGVDDVNSKYLIKITKVKNNEIIIINADAGDGCTRSGEEYTFDFAKYEGFPIWGQDTSKQLYPNVDYTISVSKIGNDSNVISSSYADLINIYRIENVQDAAIISNLGILTWTQIQDAIGYELEMVGTNGTGGNFKYTINTNTGSIDLASVAYDDGGNLLPAGNYKARIRVLANDKLNSSLTISEKTFIKLASVDAGSIKYEGSEISWEEIENAKGYKVKFEYINVLGEPINVTHIVENAKIDAPTDVDGKLKTTIIAYGGDVANLLNSNALIVTTTNEAPKPIVEGSLTYDDTLNRFEWKVNNSDFFDADKLIIRYYFTEYSLTGNLQAVEKEFTINYQNTGYYDTTNDLYYFNISIMGKYENFTVTVHRTDNIDATSQTIGKTLNLFTCGAGTEDSPYIIQNQTMLDNMKYYPNAYYKLNNDISIDNKTYTSAILDFEFAGHLDGNNHKINLGNITLQNVKEFALFKSLNGTTINNLDIAGNIENVINNQITGDVKIALLAVDSTNSTLTNVRIVTSSVSVEEGVENATNEIVGNLYVAGYFATDNNSTLTNCYIVGDGSNSGLTINLDVDVSSEEYTGSISAYANKTQVDDGEFKISITNQEGIIKYIGGLFGYYTGDNSDNKNCIIQNAEVNITINDVKSLYIGGIVGYANHVTIQNNIVSGKIIYSGLNNNTTLYFGGVAGFVSSGLVYNNTVSANIDIFINSIGENNLYLGLIVGYLGIDTNSGLNCELKGNYSEFIEQTPLTTNELTLGVYGGKAENVVIDKNYTV